MKRIALCFALVLVGCMPSVGGKPALEGYRDGLMVRYIARIEGRLAVGSTAFIASAPSGCVLTNTVAGGENTGLLCETPTDIQFRTLGRVSANIVKNGQPLTPFVIVPQF